MSGKCLVRREGGYWLAACYPDGQKMKIVRAKTFEEMKDHAREYGLKLEIVNKLKTREEGGVFALK